MPLFLKERNTEATELMDNPDCNREDLINTYHQFRVINSLISQWKFIYRTQIRPDIIESNQSCSLLDIGFGGGDIVRNLAGWVKHDGIKLTITAIETDERAYEFVQNDDIPDSITFRYASSTDLVKEGRKFNFVISNHLIHHLSKGRFYKLLQESKQLSTQKVLFNDIERSDMGYLLFNILSRPVFRSSFITSDGLTSIKRSYTLHELRQIVPERWKVKRIFPYRLLLSYHHE